MNPFQPTILKEWDSTHAEALKKFLESEAGIRALAHVVNMRPALLDGGDVNKTLVRNGEVKGFDLCLTELFSLTQEQPKAEAAPGVAYPPLDDDSQWDDRTKKPTTEPT
jgi:hypothetical protein